MGTVHQLPRPVLRAKCSACGTEATCDCNAPYVPAGQRAAVAIAANPTKSNRAIAEEIGVSDKTVAAARGAEHSATERVGKDGKKYKAAKPRAKVVPLVSDGQIHEATRGFVAMIRKAAAEEDIKQSQKRRTVAFAHFKFLIVHNGLPALMKMSADEIIELLRTI